MTEAAGAAAIECQLVADRAPRPRVVCLHLPAGATIGDAVRAACESWGEAPPDPDQVRVGVWGVQARPAQPLRSGDRVELYRPLPNDPRLARRARAADRRGSR